MSRTRQRRRSGGRCPYYLLLAVAVSLALCRNAEAEDLKLIPVVEQRPSSSHVLVGTPFEITDSTANGSSLECSFMPGESSNDSNSNTWTMQDEGPYTLLALGTYQYNCSGTGYGNVTAVPAKHSIALCKQCSEGSQLKSSRVHSINVGDLVEWSVVSKMQGQTHNCTMIISQVLGGNKSIDVNGTSSYQFNQPGVFELTCQQDGDLTARINVSYFANASEASPLTVLDSKLKPMLYTHAAIMGTIFGVILPIGAYLAYQYFAVAHFIIQVISLIGGIAGLVIVVTYVELTHKHHIQFPIHGVVGLALLLLMFVMPFLRVHKNLKTYHHRLGHIVVFFGMANVLLGLSVLSAPKIAAISLCVIYGLWLLASLAVYILCRRRKEPVVEVRSSTPSGSKNKLFEMTSRNSSFSSNISRGPQPLTKNIISEDKMIQLRKKSLDFVEAQKHRSLLDKELGLSSRNQYQDAMVDELDVKFKVGEGRRDSKPDQDDDFNSSRIPLNAETPDFDDDCPFPPPHTTIDSNQQAQLNSPSTDEEDTEHRNHYHGSADDELSPKTPKSPISPSTLTRAHTFNYGDKPIMDDDEEAEETDEYNMERGGSLRLTRHSKRVRGKVNDIFTSYSSSALLISSMSQDNTPTSPPPPICVTTSTPPISTQHMMVSVYPPEEPNNNNRSQQQIQAEVHTLSQPNTMQRRRKAALVPPVITGAPQLLDPPPACPFHNKSSLSPPRIGLEREASRSPKPIRRGISPTPSGDSIFESSPNPPRKKKVSVAQIEATVVPPTPVNLQPPAHLSLSRTSSYNTLQTHQDTFADNAFRSVMQISQDAIVCANSIGDIVFWSVGACKMFGYSPAEAVGSSLEMIIPQSYKEKHRNGITKRTDDTLKYVRKHAYTPEEQKHARLYAVHGVTKSGKEFPVEVNVTSFIIDGEIFYTGVISELTKHTGITRGNSISSGSDMSESSLKQRAMAVGAQMKIAHKLRSAEHISKRELQRVLSGSLEASNFEVEQYQMEQMIEGIMKAGDPNGSGVISFVNLIQLLSEHQLYISESGLIARYGKTKGVQGGNLSRSQRATHKVKDFFTKNTSSAIWFALYFALNVIILAVGVGAADLAGRRGWNLVAFGAGPVLSMNCVLVLLPTLSSLIHAMRCSTVMNKVFPLTKARVFHLIITIGILLWSALHVTTHLVAFAMEGRNTSSPISAGEHFRQNLVTNIVPTITGFLVAVVFAVLGIMSITAIRKQLRFIPFHLAHWIGGVIFYILLILHGVNFYSPSFWKWLLPAIIIVIIERVYRYVMVEKKKVNVKCAGRYDDASRTALVELEVPKGFKYEPGQYILLNLPWIGYFDWQPCQISSGPKDDKLTVYIPHSGNPWFANAFSQLKVHPYNMPRTVPTRNGKRGEKTRIETEKGHPAEKKPVSFSGPYGPKDISMMIYDYKVSTLVCGGGDGPHVAKAIVKKFLEFRKGAVCHCGCQPILSKLYLVWVIPSGNDFEWFTDYLSDLCEDDHLHRYMDIRVFLTNIDSPPDQLASVLLQLGLKTAGESCIVRRPSQPQLNNLFHSTSYGVPDYISLFDYIVAQHAALWTEAALDFGVFSVGDLDSTTISELKKACVTSSREDQLTYRHHHIIT